MKLSKRCFAATYNFEVQAVSRYIELGIITASFNHDKSRIFIDSDQVSKLVDGERGG